MNLSELLEEQFSTLFEDVQVVVSANNYKEVIEHYKDKEVFVTYTSLPKVGINPKSEYQTPIGIYCYDIEYISNLDSYIAPFPIDWNYFHILSPKKGIKIWKMSNYGVKDFDNDYGKISKLYDIQLLRDALYGSKADDELVELIVNKEYGELRTKKEDWPRLMFYLTNNLTQHPIKWNAILRKVLGYDLVWDDVTGGIIHGNEPRQAFFTHKLALDIVISGENYKNLNKGNDAKASSESQNKILSLLKQNPENLKDLNPKLLKNATLDADFALRMVPWYIKDNIPIPKTIIHNIANSSDSYYVRSLIDHLNYDNIPELLVKKLAKDPNDSLWYAEILLQKKLEIPEIILQSISTDALASKKYAKTLQHKNKNIPDIIIQGIALDTTQAYEYAFHKNFKDLPKSIITAISKNPYKSFNAIKTILSLNYDIPKELIEAIARDKEYLSDYLQLINYNEEKFPEEFRVYISKPLAFGIAKDLAFTDVPKWIIDIYGGIDGIIEKERWAYYYLKTKIKVHGVEIIKQEDPRILEAIAKDEDYSYALAELLQFKNVPKVIAKSVKVNPGIMTIAEEGFSAIVGKILR